MKESFERVTERHGGQKVPVKHLFRRQYQNAKGEWRTIFYGIFTDCKGKRRKFPLGADLAPAKEQLKILEGRNVKREDFDADKVRAKPGLTVDAWSESYFDLEEVKRKRSLGRDRTLVKPVVRLLGENLLTELTREDLFGYQNARRQEGIIRGGKEQEKKVADGTIKLELALLRRMINLARDRNLQTSTVSFRGAIPEAETRDRIY